MKLQPTIGMIKIHLFNFQSEATPQIISSPSSIDNLLQMIKNKLQQITTEYPDLFPNSTDDILHNLDQLLLIIKNQQNQIHQLQTQYQQNQAQLQRYFPLFFPNLIK